MIQGTFDVAIDTPKHHKRGTLALKSQGEHISARLKAGEDFDREFDGTCTDKEFDFEGTDEFPGLGKVNFKAHGSTWGNSIDVSCQTDAGKVDIFGTRLSLSAGEFKSSHDYIMSASKAEFARHDGSMYSGLYSDGG